MLYSRKLLPSLLQTLRRPTSSAFSTFPNHPDSPASANDWIYDTDHGKCLIFGKSSCGFSSMAIKILSTLNVEYTAVQLDTRTDGAAIQQELGELTGMRTVPSIWIEGKFIGGYSELTRVPEEELVGMLRKAGALESES